MRSAKTGPLIVFAFSKEKAWNCDKKGNKISVTPATVSIGHRVGIWTRTTLSHASTVPQPACSKFLPHGSTSQPHASVCMKQA